MSYRQSRRKGKYFGGEVLLDEKMAKDVIFFLIFAAQRHPYRSSRDLATQIANYFSYELGVGDKDH